MKRVLFFACLWASVMWSPASAADQVPVATIALSPHGQYWRVVYTLPRPARELRFARADRAGNRVRDWIPLDTGVVMALQDGEEVVRRKDGRRFSTAGFDMLPRYRTLEKDYAPFSPFGDGGLLIHSGRFQACPDRCDEDAAVWRVTVAPLAGSHVIVDGRVAPTAGFDDRGDGTNIYVGRARPVETANVVAVIDQAFPVDARTRLESLLPRLMELYGAELGRLPFKPMLFASRDADHPGGGYGFQGGTLPGQIFMHLYGRHEAFGQPEFADRMDWFFAHEAAHLYQRYPSLADAGDTWIHEGGADALAMVALLQLDVITRAAIATRLASSVDACAAGIAEHPLSRAHIDGSFDSFYACGFVMQMAVDAAARRASAGRCGLFCVWRDFLGRVNGGERWNTETFAAIVARDADPATAEFVRAVSGQVPPQPVQFLQGGLRRAGVRLESSGNGH